MNSIPSSVPVVQVDMIQAVALAVVMYAFGSAVKKRVSFLTRFSVPAPVVGGMSLALLLSILEGFDVVKVNFDGTLQTQLMLAFFTTIGLMASLKILRSGGKLLIGFLIASTVLCLLQNVVGSSIASAMGIDPRYGVLAGSVSMMGGLGTSAAFGPYFEETFGLSGGTAVAISSATFGMVAALIIGAPFGEWLIRRYKVPTTAKVAEPEPPLHIPEEVEIPVTEDDGPALTREIMHAVGIVTICMAAGTVVSKFLGQYITLPAYIGSMIVAAVARNVADVTGWFRADGKGMIPAVECLIGTPSVRKLIADRDYRGLEDALRRGTESGMITFNRALFRLFREQRITAETALTASDNREELALLLKGMESGVDAFRSHYNIDGLDDGRSVDMRRLLRAAVKMGASDLLLTYFIAYGRILLAGSALECLIFRPPFPGFGLGLILFTCCDVCVGLQNLFRWFPDAGGPLVAFARVGMWLFYLPAQVLLAQSVERK